MRQLEKNSDSNVFILVLPDTGEIVVFVTLEELVEAFERIRKDD